MKPKHICPILLLLASLFSISGRCYSYPAQTAEEFRFVPIRIHLLRSTVARAVNSKLTPRDIERIVRKANGIWHAAGIHLWVESILDEKAANAEERRDDIVLTLDSLLPLRPAFTRADGMFHVYFVGAMSVNGVYMAPGAIFVQDEALLRQVPGGIDEPLPRVTSHELGHGLGLPHRQDRTNLMASGTTGTSLNEAEIETVTKRASELPWIQTAEAFLDDAEQRTSHGHGVEAAERFRAILSLPGDSALKRRAASDLARIGQIGRGAAGNSNAKPL